MTYKITEADIAAFLRIRESFFAYQDFLPPEWADLSDWGSIQTTHLGLVRDTPAADHLLAAYLGWYCLVHSDRTILLVMKRKKIQKIRALVQAIIDHHTGTALELRPRDSYRESVQFENGSRLIFQAPCGCAGRGMSWSVCVFWDVGSWKGKVFEDLLEGHGVFVRTAGSHLMLVHTGPLKDNHPAQALNGADHWAVLG